MTQALRSAARVTVAAASSVGEFYGLALDTAVALGRRDFQWREFVDQSWFIARVSLLPTILMSIPFTVLVVFTLNSLLSNSGQATSAVRERAWAR